MLARQLEDHSRSNVSKTTLNTRISALKRIERFQQIDLDQEFERDQMATLLEAFTYSAEDERTNRPNPTKMKIGEQSLRSVLTWYRSHLNQYRQFRMSGDAPNKAGDDLEQDGVGNREVSGRNFAFEADLQTALRENIGSLEQGLMIVDDGMERHVASGFIDILAQDKDGAFVVVELKAGPAKDAVVAQTLGYMGDLQETTDRNVRGIIVAAEFGKRVKSAAKAIPNLDLKTYTFSFEFS